MKGGYNMAGGGGIGPGSTNVCLDFKVKHPGQAYHHDAWYSRDEEASGIVKITIPASAVISGTVITVDFNKDRTPIAVEWT